MNTDFSLAFSTVDNITDALRNVSMGTHLYKVDDIRAFRHIKIDPYDFDLLGLKWRDATYFDTQIFQRLRDAVHFKMCDARYDVINYVNDFVGVSMPNIIKRSFDYLRNLLQELGLGVSNK